MERIAQIIGEMNSGGVEAVVMNYYRHINRSEIQFDFFVDEGSSVPYKNEILDLGGRIFYVPKLRHFFNYRKCLKKMLKENHYSIVHSHISTLSIFPLAIAKKLRIPVRIAHSHSTSTTSKKEFLRNIGKELYRKLSKVFATHYFACGTYSGSWMFSKKTFLKGDVHILNNAIEVNKFQFHNDVRIKKRLELGINSQLVLGSVGRFVSQKNHTVLIDIFAEIVKKNHNAILILIGEGPLQEEIFEKVKMLGLDKNVLFLGVRHDVNELMQAMDVFLLPSLYEGLPVVGIEAQASGLLCIFSDEVTREIGLLPETQFLSLKESPLKWAEAILDKAKNYQRKDCSDEIRRHHFDIEKEAKKLEEFYLKVK